MEETAQLLSNFMKYKYDLDKGEATAFYRDVGPNNYNKQKI